MRWHVSEDDWPTVAVLFNSRRLCDRGKHVVRCHGSSDWALQSCWTAPSPTTTQADHGQKLRSDRTAKCLTGRELQGRAATMDHQEVRRNDHRKEAEALCPRAYHNQVVKRRTTSLDHKVDTKKGARVQLIAPVQTEELVRQ